MSFPTTTNIVIMPHAREYLRVPGPGNNTQNRHSFKHRPVSLWTGALPPSDPGLQLRYRSYLGLARKVIHLDRGYLIRLIVILFISFPEILFLNIVFQKNLID